MRWHAIIGGAAMLLLSLWASTAAAQTFRCRGQLIMEGDSAASVLDACGAPDFRDPWVATNGFGPPMVEWTYNKGSQQLIQVILFRGDQVAATGTEGYGFATDGRLPPSGSCEPSFIQPGMSKYRLLSACGPPISSVGWFITSTRLYEPGYRIYLRGNTGPFVFRERYTYNFGDNRLIRYVTLDNAQVTDVVIGNRGFDR